MIDIYLSSCDLQKLVSFCATQPHVIGPVAGVAAQERSTGCEGQAPLLCAAQGDPKCFYACIRRVGAVEIPEGIDLCDAETGRSVVGVWAG